MKRLIICCYLIAIAILLISCVKGSDELDIILSPSSANIVDLISVKYDEMQLNDISSFDGTISELNSFYKIECIRKIDTGYRVAYQGSNAYGILLFDNDGIRVFGHICKATVSKSDFDFLSIGESVTNVVSVDPDGEYFFIYTGRNDIPRVSTHYTNDGYIISITYDNEMRIIELKEELI